MSDFHQPVLLAESLAAMVTNAGGIYVDATFGGGGHSRALLPNLEESAKLYAFDQDADAIGQRFNDPRLVLTQSNFRYIGNFLQYFKVPFVDGILADLGVSSYQIDADHKGFSFQRSEMLDMRMNQKSELTAEVFLNRVSEMELLQVLSEYGEVRNAKSVAKAIVQRRRFRPIKTVQELLLCLDPLVMGNRSRYFAQLFQAIRIKVNDEMGALEALLKTSEQILRPGGKLVVITYHSIEDRMVKHFMKSGRLDGKRIEADYFSEKKKWSLKPLTKKPILPTALEIKQNKRSRSAKLRIAEKIVVEK